MNHEESQGLSEDHKAFETHSVNPEPQCDMEEGETCAVEVHDAMLVQACDEDTPEVGEAPEAGGEKEETKKGASHANPALSEYLEALTKQPDAEAKLRLTIDFMQQAVSQTGNPHFKNFWEGRKHCLELFKENINPSLRVQLWAKYRELSDEARRLKDILDEQAAFATEQIDVAIKALETDIEQFSDRLAKVSDVTFSLPSKTLDPKLENYMTRQKELNLLNAFASKVNSLRKELIKTDMRISHKNKFFKRLSTAGDNIFPRRKELIKDISQLFIQDIEAFISGFQSDDDISNALFFYREEIKALQGVAKVLTLNTHAFTTTRAKLSECWDKIKKLEKDRKKEQSQKKQQFKENADAAFQKIEALKTAFDEGQVHLNDALKQLDEISSEMRQVELGRQEIAQLRDALNAVRRTIMDKVREKENERQREEAAKEQQQRERVQNLKESITRLLKEGEGYEAEQLTEMRDALLEEMNKLRLGKADKLEMDRLFKPFRDLISDKKERAMLSLSDDDRQALDQLKEVLKQRKQRQKEVKEQLEILRKAGGSSGLDFEQAMVHTQQVNAEKERLEKAVQGIKEVEKRIAELERKI